MNKGTIKSARKQLQRLRDIIAKNPTPIFRMSKEEVIKTLRKTREAIWEEKLAPRH